MSFKKLSIAVVWLLIIILAFGMTSCNSGDTDTPTETPTSVPTQAPTQAPTEKPTEAATTEAPTSAPTEAPTATEAPAATEVLTEATTESATQGSTQIPTENITEPPSEIITEPPTEAPTEQPTEDLSIYNDSTVDVSDEHIVDESQWVATDGLDRVVSTNTQTGDVRDDKIVAIFYWSWHGNYADNQTAYNNEENINKLISMGYSERDYVNMSVAQLNALGIYTTDMGYHFWDEPVYGYYDGDDEWVIRKQAELLAAAGVDVVFFDNTNGTYTWIETAMKVMKVFSEAREQGVDAPAVSFMLPFGPFIDSARPQLIKLYEEIYSKNYYSDIWFRLDDKPMIMAWKTCLDINDPTQKAIYDLFDFRANMAGYLDTETAADQWGWLSCFPQAYYHNSKGEVEQMTVGTAINHDYVNKIIGTMSSGGNIIGRNWTSRGLDTTENAILYGACFVEQWENALEVDPKVVFVTGWNEWVALRIPSWSPGGTGMTYTNCFVDQYNAQYSRDCEPSNGILKDHYYYQLADYIRQFKGTNAIEMASGETTIDINGGFGQWHYVGPVYNDYFGLTDRDHAGYTNPATGEKYYYTNTTGRNDFYDAKIARDGDNIYFMVRTVDDITPYTDAYWMRLYIDMGESNINWENYEFILNKQNPDNKNTATLERFTGNGFETEVVGKISYSVQGNVMMVCIPKTMLGIPASQADFEFSFKWADNTCEDGDIMQWYVNGDTAPVGRWNYCYSTTGSEEYDPASKNPGSSYLDLTDTATQKDLIDYFIMPTVNMDYEFTSEGLVLTSTAVGSAADFVLSFTKTSPRVMLNNYKSIEITYKVTDGTTNAMRVSIGSKDTYFVASNSKARLLSLTADGEEHTVSSKLVLLQVTTGYLNQVGIYFGRNAPAGSSIIITSIRFVE